MNMEGWKTGRAGEGMEGVLRFIPQQTLYDNAPYAFACKYVEVEYHP
jgi:hypothetical protein